MKKRYMVYFYDLTTRQNLGIWEGDNKEEVIAKVKSEFSLNDNASLELKEVN